MLLIGHNPGMQDLALRIARPGAHRDAVGVKFPTCALATLEAAGPWSAIGHRAELVGYMVPKRLP